MTPNPFCTGRVRPGAIPYRFPAGVDHATAITAICETLARRQIGLVVGPHGSGKSTLLHALKPALLQRFALVEAIQLCQTDTLRRAGRVKHGRHAYAQIRALAARLRPGSPDRALLIVDGLEQLLPLDRWRLAWTARTRGPAVLATSHATVVAWPTLYQTACDRQRVIELTEELLRDSPPEVVARVRDHLAAQDWNPQINARDLWFDCYDTVQDQLLKDAVPTAAPWRLAYPGS